MTRNPPFRLLAALALLAAPALLPAGAAHSCTAPDPAEQCGECWSGQHDHWDSDGSLYCMNTSPWTIRVCTPELCVYVYKPTDLVGHLLG